MSISRAVLAALLMTMLAGCADEAQVYSPYLEENFQPWMGQGRTTLNGQGFYKMPSGRLISCAGSEVLLIPANGYNVEALQSIGSGTGFPENYNRSAYKFVRRTICDGAGRFVFQNVPTQNWIVMIHLTWQESDAIMFWMKNDKGGTLYQEVQPDIGETKIILSNNEFVADQK